MLHTLQQQHPGKVGGLLTTLNEAFDRVAMHAVRRMLVEAQADAAQSAAVRGGHPVAVFERRLRAAHGRCRKTLRRARGLPTSAFGDLFLEDVRRYREERLAGTGLAPIFPLWKTKPTADLAREMIDGGLRAHLTCVDPRKLDAVIRRPSLRSVAARPICRLKSIRAERMASFIRLCRMDRCSATRWMWPSAMSSTRDGFVFADLICTRFPADRLPDRRNHRDPLPARRRRSRRRHFGLHRPAARGATEAEGLVVPARALREDRGARARSRSSRFPICRPTSRPSSCESRLSGLHLQSAQRRGDPPDDPHARRHRRRAGQGGRPRTTSSRMASTGSARQRHGSRDGRACTSRNGTTR